MLSGRQSRRDESTPDKPHHGRRLAVFLLLVNLAGFLWLSRAIRHDSVGPSSYVLAFVWLSSAAVLLRTAARRDARDASRDSRPRTRPLRDRLAQPQLVMVCLILVVALVFRSAELDRLPWGYAGLHLDAAYNSAVAFRILDGLQFFMPVTPSAAYCPYARDTLTHYYLAAFYALLGRSIDTLRLACNLLGLFNCGLFFLIVRRYTRSTLVVAGVTALYAFSGTDAVFAASGMEYIMATPFLLGSFLLLTRAMRRGRAIDATLAGFVWGLGFSSHYSYLYLGMVVPAVAVVHLRPVKVWLRDFLVAAFLGALPKASYLLFNHQAYFQRFFEVARHDASGQFFVPEHFRQSAEWLGMLLFRTNIHFKSLLPEDPIIPPLYVPLLLLGMAVALRDFRRPEHSLVLLVVGLSLAAALASFVQDYRFQNAMPALFLALAIGLSRIETIAGTPRGQTALVLLLSLLVVKSVAAYFSHPDNPALRQHYGTKEVALAKRIATIDPHGTTYVLGPDVTQRTKFLNPQNPYIDQLNYAVEFAPQRLYSRVGESAVFGNVDAVLKRELPNPLPVHFVISPDSAYGQRLRRYLTTLAGSQVRSLDATDAVGHAISTYYWISVPAQGKQAAQEAQPTAGRFAAADVRVPQRARGTLHLTTFADREQSLVVDERNVPALLDLDFPTQPPYPGPWGSDFSLRWSGYLLAERQGDHRLEASFDDGCRIFLDGDLVLADWLVGSVRTRAVTVHLEQGWHQLRIDYQQYTAEAHLSFRMAPAPEPPVAVPAEALAAWAETPGVP
jgi:4-amino-4-deoxy-L-arabinose transferase-like glycosyltransferase